VVIQQKAGPRADLAVDKTDPFPYEIVEASEVQRISRRRKETQVPVEEIDDDRLDMGEAAIQIGDVVLPAFGIEQVRPGDVGVALFQRRQSILPVLAEKM
jgi:hypothetical protein